MQKGTWLARVGVLSMVLLIVILPGCGRTESNQSPTAKIQSPTETAKISVEESVSFEAEAQDMDGTVKRYIWDFGDGNRTEQTERIVRHVYHKPGSYTVKLIAVDNEGAESEEVTLKVLIREEAPPSMPIPAIYGYVYLWESILGTDEVISTLKEKGTDKVAKFVQQEETKRQREYFISMSALVKGAKLYIKQKGSETVNDELRAYISNDIFDGFPIEMVQRAVRFVSGEKAEVNPQYTDRIINSIAQRLVANSLNQRCTVVDVLDAAQLTFDVAEAQRFCGTPPVPFSRPPLMFPSSEEMYAAYWWWFVLTEVLGHEYLQNALNSEVDFHHFVASTKDTAGRVMEEEVDTIRNLHAQGKSEAVMKHTARAGIRTGMYNYNMMSDVAGILPLTEGDVLRIIWERYEENGHQNVTYIIANQATDFLLQNIMGDASACREMENLGIRVKCSLLAL